LRAPSVGDGQRGSRTMERNNTASTECAICGSFARGIPPGNRVAIDWPGREP